MKFTKRDERNRERAADLLERAATSFEDGEISWGQGALYQWSAHEACAYGNLMRMAGVDSPNIDSSETYAVMTAAKAMKHVLLADPSTRDRIKGMVEEAGQSWLGPRTGAAAIIFSFNDNIETDAAEVVDVMKHAAKVLRHG